MSGPAPFSARSLRVFRRVALERAMSLERLDRPAVLAPWPRSLAVIGVVLLAAAGLMLTAATCEQRGRPDRTVVIQAFDRPAVGSAPVPSRVRHGAGRRRSEGPAPETVASDLPSENPEITGLLRAFQEGDKSAFDALAPAVHGELRRIAPSQLRSRRSSDTLQTTALVNEAYLRLVEVSGVSWGAVPTFSRSRR